MVLWWFAAFGPGMRLRAKTSGIINGFITAGIAGDGNYGLSIWVEYGLALDWRRVIPHNGLNLNANLSAPSYECCRLHAGPAAGPAVGTGVRDAGESRRRFLSIDTPQHQHCMGGHRPASTQGLLRACQGHHLSTAHAAHAAPAVVMRDTCCFFCLLDTGTHGKKQKRRWHLDTGRPASKRSANSGGCLETVSHSIPPQS